MTNQKFGDFRGCTAGDRISVGGVTEHGTEVHLLRQRKNYIRPYPSCASAGSFSPPKPPVSSHRWRRASTRRPHSVVAVSPLRGATMSRGCRRGGVAAPLLSRWIRRTRQRPLGMAETWRKWTQRGCVRILFVRLYSEAGVIRGQGGLGLQSTHWRGRGNVIISEESNATMCEAGGEGRTQQKCINILEGSSVGEEDGEAGKGRQPQWHFGCFGVDEEPSCTNHHLRLESPSCLAVQLVCL